MTRRRATYQTGFAPRDFAPAHPELWAGIVGAWCPSLGPTGATLYDWGGKRFDGALQGLTADAIWKPHTGQYAINPTHGTYGGFDVGNCGSGLTTGTISLWARPAVENAYQCAFAVGGAGVWTWNCRFSSSTDGTPSTGNMYCNLRVLGLGGGVNNTISATTTILAAGTWYHIVISGDGTTYRVWVNGVEQSISAIAGSNNGAWFGGIAQSGTPHLMFGRSYFNGTYDSFGFNGHEDDFRYYSRVLTPNEVATLHQGGRGIAYLPRRRYAVNVGLQNYTLTAEPGSLALTGNDADLIYNVYALTAEAGELTLTGNDAGLTAARILTAETGALTLTGNDAGLSAPRTIEAEPGLLVLVGLPAELLTSYKLTAAAGALALTGNNAGGQISDGLPADTGALTFTGNDATLTATRTLTAETGALSLTGIPAAFPPRQRVLLAQTGALSLAGNAVTSARTLKANTGALSLTGNPATLSVDTSGGATSPFRSRIFQSRTISA